MRSFVTFSAVVMIALCIAAGLSLGDDDPKQQPRYVAEGFQYYPAAPELDPASAAKPTRCDEDAFGAKLFSKVTTVWFAGPSNPANPDGSLGGLVAKEADSTITIYERFIVRETVGPDKTVYRTAYAYETLGMFEQQIKP